MGSEASKKAKNQYGGELFQPSFQHNAKEVKRLLEKKAQVNARQPDNLKWFSYLSGHAHKNAWTPLHFACRYSGGNQETIKLLIDAKADLDARDLMGRTPGHIAARFADHKALRMLHDSCRDRIWEENVKYLLLPTFSENISTIITELAARRMLDLSPPKLLKQCCEDTRRDFDDSDMTDDYPESECTATRELLLELGYVLE
mmetsp:Transcript_13801/g.16501  ORF Transcript_13801/g.16501 Transcript_13801/m.16501 type:complete len:202 (+) Transcript_13801:87-692(+)